MDIPLVDRCDEEGSEIVSLVLTMPFVVFLFAMLVTFSQLLYAGSVALNAANAGGRCAIVSDSYTSAKAGAENAAARYVEKSGMGISIASSELQKTDGAWARGKVATFTVSVKVRTMLPMVLPQGGFSTNYIVTRSCPMMIER